MARPHLPPCPIRESQATATVNHQPSSPGKHCNGASIPDAGGNRPFGDSCQFHSSSPRQSHRVIIGRDGSTGRKMINQYHIIGGLSRGAHSKVKLAFDTESGQEVVIKIISRRCKQRLGQSTTSPLREATILRNVRHANVIALLEVMDDPEQSKIYLVLEYAKFGDISWREKGMHHICQHEQRRVRCGTDRDVEKRQEGDKLGLPSLRSRRRAPDFYKPASAEEEGGVDWWQQADFRNTGMNTWPRTDPWSWMSAQSGCLRTWRRDPGLEAIGGSDMITSFAHKTNACRLDSEECLSQDPACAAGTTTVNSTPFRYVTRARDSVAEQYRYVPCLTFEQTRLIIQDTVLGLECLHSHGIIHRDIKPGNLLCGEGYRVKICDFSVSFMGRPICDEIFDRPECDEKGFDDEHELFKTVGTPAFIAPELCSLDPDYAHSHVSAQVDVWSLGVTLYCLVFARLPFIAEGEFQLFRKIATEDVYIPRRRLRPVLPSTSLTPSIESTTNNYRRANIVEYEDVDDSLVDLLQKMLTRHPEKRICLEDVKRHTWLACRTTAQPTPLPQQLPRRQMPLSHKDNTSISVL